MKKAVKVTAGLAALVLAVVAVSLFTHGHGIPLGLMFAGAGLVFGTVTITYTWPVAGTVAPTGAQAAKTNVVIGTLNWADSDTTAPIIHNYGLSTAAGAFPNTATFCPEVNLVSSGAGTAPGVSQTVVWTDGNTVTIGKTSTAGTGGTVVFYLRRPSTPAQ